MRKLASIRIIDGIEPIVGADFIEIAKIGGWKVIVKKGEFAVNNAVVYFEIDSFIPHELAPFLSKGKKPREYNGVKGEILRTIKLRGQVSQGLILKMSDLFDDPSRFEIGQDVSALLNIQKYEKPIPANLSGKVSGRFPTHLVRKTDQERIQNIFNDVSDLDDEYEVTLKLDGTSCTLISYGSDYKVCSRNLELDLDSDSDNSYIRIFNKYFESLKMIDNYAIQGEIMGPGIQGNRENLSDIEFYVFDIYDITNQKYLLPHERLRLVEYLNMKHVPIIEMNAKLSSTVEEEIELANNQRSINNPIAEGRVYKSMNSSTSFKVISNKFLLKEE